MVEVGDEIVEVDLHDSLVRLALQGFGNIFEMKTASSFQQYGSMRETVEGMLAKAILSGVVKGRGDGGKEGRVAAQGLTNADKVVDTMTEDDFKAKGVNSSMTHVDFMVGSADLEITGITHDGEEIPVFRNGTFVF